MDNNFVRNQVLTRFGGTDSSLVIPKFNFSKFEDEFWVDINHTESSAILRKDLVQESVDKYQIISGDLKHVFYQKNDGFEYEIWFQEPPKPELTFTLTYADGLSFNKQFSLTEEEIKSGFLRSEEIINSIAVYCNRKNHIYETGKIAHFKRPFITDSKGRKVWCDQIISGNVWTVLLPEDVLKDLVYPICLGPEIGYSTDGGSAQSIELDLFIFVGGTNSGGGGEVNFVKAYATSAGTTGRAGLYSGATTPTTKAFGPGDQTNIPFSAPVTFNIGSWTLESDTAYWTTLELNGDNDTIYLKYDSTDVNSNYSAGVGPYPATWPNNPPMLNDLGFKTYSVWTDYTETSSPIATYRNYYEMLRRKEND
jgi:hypothetical protein